MVYDTPDAGGGLETLSLRERAVLELLVPGLTSREIAGMLGITERTVRFHIGRILSKLGVTNRTEAAALYAALASPAALAQLPRAPTLFGREAELASLLTHATKTPSPVIAIEGMGGVGKTALAVALAHALRPRYRDAQIMLDLLGTTMPLVAEEVMQHVVHSLVPQIGSLDSPARVASAYRSLLASRRVLLLLDNASDRAQVEPLLPPEGCALIVTSRTRLALAPTGTLRLEALSKDAARALLLAHAPHAGEAATAVAKLCGCLPLALGLASRTLAARPDLDPSDFADRLVAARERIAYLDQTDAEHGVGASLGLSYSMLGEVMQRALCELSVFTADFDREAAAFLWQVDDRAADDRIGELGRRHLLEWNGRSGAAARYRLHDLVALFASQRLAAGERLAAEERHARHCARLLASASEQWERGGDGVTSAFSSVTREWENIRQALHFVSQNMQVRRAAAQLCIEYGQRMVLLESRLHPREQLTLLTRKLEAARKLEDRRAEATALYLLGRTYLLLQDPAEALRCCEEGRRIAREIGDRGIDGACLGTLTSIHLFRGDLARALAFAHEHYDVATRESLPRQRASALLLMGMVHQSRGEPREALVHLEQQLELARSLGDRHDESRGLGALGSVHHVLGNVDEAERCWTQQLELAHSLGDLRSEGLALGNLGHVHLAKRDFDAARRCYAARLSNARETGDRRGEVVALANLGNLHNQTGESREAIALHEQCLTVAEEMSDRRVAGSVLCNLGEAHAALGHWQIAVDHYVRAIAVLRGVGDRRSEVIASFNLGRAYRAMGDLARAIACMEPRIAFESGVGRADPALCEELDVVRRQHAAARGE